ncbi:MAG: hypothetical protein CMH64_02955 [Nanoarchaeota archaeon]|jgi:hypothetical protein|nr:hypothetical protein [Nanoarchaeota archaeon]|tara:strand:- start:1466 stop:1699 length:234 start_codon:yes stop_codon:yes gene_type:complete
MKWLNRIKKRSKKDKELRIREIKKSDFLMMKVDIKDYESDIDRDIKLVKRCYIKEDDVLTYIEEDDKCVRIAYYEKN